MSGGAVWVFYNGDESTMKYLILMRVFFLLWAFQNTTVNADKGLVRPTENEARLALVIGNQAYDDKPLKNPVNDARDIKAALEQLGFQVIYRTDASQEVMEDALREFGQRLHRDGVGLFYYSGHGVQADDSNFLIPVQAKIPNKTELKNRAIDAGSVLETMEQVGSKVNIVILDACRDNPFRGYRSATAGLASMSGPAGSLIAYATGPGKTAEDGFSGTNGVYTKHLLRYLSQPGLPVENMFKRVREAVRKETGGEQVPWENSSLIGDFCFNGCSNTDVIFQDDPARTSYRIPDKINIKPFKPRPSIATYNAGIDYGPVIGVIESFNAEWNFVIIRMNDTGGFSESSTVYAIDGSGERLGLVIKRINNNTAAAISTVDLTRLYTGMNIYSK